MPDNSNVTAATDQQLVAATLNGDLTAFGNIVQRYWNMAVALALGKIDDPVEAEDIAQESFIKAYSQLDKLRNPSCFVGWLSKIVAQQCTNQLRAKARNKAVLSYQSPTIEALEPSLPCSTDCGLTKQQIHFVRRTIRRLPEKFQKLIIMRFVAGLSAAQIAKQLGKRHGTVRVGLHRAYKLLRKELAPVLEEAEQ